MIDHNTDDRIAISPGPENPEDQAREVVDAMRAGGTLTPEVEAALMGAGRQHAQFLDRHGELNNGG